MTARSITSKSITILHEGKKVEVLPLVAYCRLHNLSYSTMCDRYRTVKHSGIIKNQGSYYVNLKTIDKSLKDFPIKKKKSSTDIDKSKKFGLSEETFAYANAICVLEERDLAEYVEEAVKQHNLKHSLKTNKVKI